MNKANTPRRVINLLVVLAALLYASSAFAQHADPRRGASQNDNPPSTTDEVGYGNSAGGSSKIGRSLRTGAGFGASALTYGVTGKLYLTDSDALQGVVGNYWSNGIAFSADYVRHIAKLGQAPVLGEFYAYLGAGGNAVLYDNGVNSTTAFGVSGVVGVAWHLGILPVELTAEWRPTFLIGDYIGGPHLEGGGGAVRWYF